MLQVDNVLQSVEEPNVNLCQLLNSFHAVSFLQGLCDGKDAKVCGIRKCFVEIVKSCMVIADKSMHALTYHA